MIRYDIAAALAVNSANLADALDEGRDDWHRYSAYSRGLLDLLDTAGTDDPRTAAIINCAITAPWFTIRDAYNDAGQWVGYQVNAGPDDWTDPREPSVALLGFLQSARLDVLTLAAEVRRLRTMLDQRPTDDPAGWACPRCDAAYFTPPPVGGLCPDCRLDDQPF